MEPLKYTYLSTPDSPHGEQIENLVLTQATVQAEEKDNILGQTLGQPSLDNHSYTNIYTQTSYTKYCPMFHVADVVISLVCRTASIARMHC